MKMRAPCSSLLCLLVMGLRCPAADAADAADDATSASVAAVVDEPEGDEGGCEEGEGEEGEEEEEEACASDNDCAAGDVCVVDNSCAAVCRAPALLGETCEDRWQPCPLSVPCADGLFCDLDAEGDAGRCAEPDCRQRGCDDENTACTSNAWQFDCAEGVWLTWSCEPPRCAAGCADGSFCARSEGYEGEDGVVGDDDDGDGWVCVCFGEDCQQPL